MGSGSFLKVVAKNFDVLAGKNALVLDLDRYASVKAIETKSSADDQQWLTYWVLYSFMTLFELTFAKVLEWLPIWSYAKLMFSCWLVLPYFNGAAYVYQHFVRPLFVNHQTVNIWYIPRKEDLFSKPDDILSAAKRYIEENGPKAFEKLISKAPNLSLQSERAPKARRTILEEVQAQRESHSERDSKSWSENCTIFDGDYRY
nr:PREDICTED: HVA22-like protein a isoform X1 [Musa acuminata subsp. malaccensis]XP_018678479.1 PREDICTED: HVA22-like protein a isoform X1 [Musa acuminata subsp. malaccensis]